MEQKTLYQVELYLYYLLWKTGSDEHGSISSELQWLITLNFTEYHRNVSNILGYQLRIFSYP